MAQAYLVSFRKKRGRPARVAKTKSVDSQRSSDPIGILKAAEKLTSEQYTAAVLYQTLYLQAQQVSESPRLSSSQAFLTEHQHTSIQWESESEFIEWQSRKRMLWRNLQAFLLQHFSLYSVRRGHNLIVGGTAEPIASVLSADVIDDVTGFLDLVSVFFQEAPNKALTAKVLSHQAAEGVHK